MVLRGLGGLLFIYYSLYALVDLSLLLGQTCFSHTPYHRLARWLPVRSLARPKALLVYIVIQDFVSFDSF